MRGQAVVVFTLILAVIFLALLLTAADGAVMQLMNSLRDGGILQMALTGH